jgi:hypothetical protein
MGVEGDRSESVDEQHDRVVHRREAQTPPLTAHRREAIRQHVGEAEPVRFRRR